MGLGYNTSMSDALDIFARLSYESIDFNAPVVGNDDDGYGFSVGARFRASSVIELTGAINYVDYSSRGDDTAAEVGVLYNFDDTWTLGFMSEWGDDVSTYRITGRYYFGN